ncbi:alpha/beta fold hydrolase [Pseudonocardia sp. H11422]|uniref:alpha/beta fold hydrolase n=1 Tax=Pseudonocardia sp. H11422 TaxID=2835866 RepID=UPI002027E3F1|nr:alpha/beta fold hydrolase [Pseudonocardia sp. H11422]
MRAPTARELALRGHRRVAVDLPGHGLGATIPTGYLGAQDLDALAAAPSGMAGISTADDVASVCEVVRRAAEHGPVILVGASRGGLTLTAVARRSRSALQAALLADGSRGEPLAYLHTQEPDEALVVDEAGTRADPSTWAGSPAPTSGRPRTGPYRRRFRTASSPRPTC